MYKSPLSSDLTTESESQIFIGLQGAPGTGKTTSAMTFPNPVVINWDRGLRAFIGRKDIIQFPMYSTEFIVEKLGIKPANGHKLPSIPAACKKLLEDCTKLTAEQTLVWDSWTTHQDIYDIWNWEVPYYTKDGKVDEFRPWQEKQDHSGEVIKLLKELKCNVVVIYHTMQVRDKNTGVLLDKEQPLMQGGFTPKIKKNFPFFFRQSIEEDKISKERSFLWQTKSDGKFDAKCCVPQDSKIPQFIPANYESLMKYLNLPT